MRIFKGIVLGIICAVFAACGRETPPVDFVLLEFNFLPDTEIIEVVGAFKNNTGRTLGGFVPDLKFMDFDSINEWLLRETNKRPLLHEIDSEQTIFLTFQTATGTKEPFRVYCVKEPMRLIVSADWKACPRDDCERLSAFWQYKGRCKAVSPDKYAFHWRRVEK